MALLMGPPPARVEVFLDHSNFYNGLKQQFGSGGCDFLSLVTEVVGGRPLVAWNLYCGKLDPAIQAPEAKKQDGYHRALGYVATKNGIPLKLRLRDLMYPPGFPNNRDGRKPQEKGVDALIVQDMIVGAFDERYEVACLLSGDRDFNCVIEFIKTRFPKIRLETLYPNSRRHLVDMVRPLFDVARVLDRNIHRRIQRVASTK